MQVFVCDTDPLKAARSLDDRRVNKLILETHQVLHLATGAGEYSWTNVNHRVCCWARTKFGYNWTIRYHEALFSVYCNRTGNSDHSAYYQWPDWEDCLVATDRRVGTALGEFKGYGLGGEIWCNATGFVLGSKYAIRDSKVLVSAYRKRLALKWEEDGLVRIGGESYPWNVWLKLVEKEIWNV